MDSATPYIFQIAILIFSVVIHEVSHGYAALMLGDKTAQHEGRLTLNPISHLSFFGMVVLPLLTLLAWGQPVGAAKPVPYNPYNLRNQKWGPSIVAAAGPAANLLVALLIGLVVRFISSFPQNVFMINFTPALLDVVYINILLAIFNLIPIPPIDGSKVIFPFLPGMIRQKIIVWWHAHRFFFAEYWAFVLIGLVLLGPRILYFLFLFITPAVNFLFLLFTGLGVSANF